MLCPVKFPVDLADEACPVGPSFHVADRVEPLSTHIMPLLSLDQVGVIALAWIHLAKDDVPLFDLTVG